MLPDHGRFKNFDTIRLIAAASVIFSHAFLLAEGSERNEPFVPWLGSIIGIYGVYVFLIMSGFLVSRSLQSSPSLPAFLWRRFLRIYPALGVCAFACAFLVAPFFSSLGPSEYLQGTYDLWYTIKVLLLRVKTGIPTVEFYVDPSGLGRVVNGSLWSVVQEIACYFLLFAVALLGPFTLRTAAVGLALGTILFLLRHHMPTSFLEDFTYALPSFSAGMIMHFVLMRHRLSGAVALGCLAILLLAASVGYLDVIFPLPAAYIVIYLAVSTTISLGDGARFGDLSYGTYLYGWPVQQVLRSTMGEGANPWLLFVIALPVALGCAWLSWHFIEKPAMQLKNSIPFWSGAKIDLMRSMKLRT